MNKTIQINQLLIEREDALIELADLEQEINDVLGQPYPFTQPVELPSRQKRKKPKRKAKPRAPKAIRVRKLDPETESAYRICYTDNETEKIEIHLDPRPLGILLNTPLPHIQVHYIETVQAGDENEWNTVEELFNSRVQ